MAVSKLNAWINFCVFCKFWAILQKLVLGENYDNYLQSDLRFTQDSIEANS